MTEAQNEPVRILALSKPIKTATTLLRLLYINYLPDSWRRLQRTFSPPYPQPSNEGYCTQDRKRGPRSKAMWLFWLNRRHICRRVNKPILFISLLLTVGGLLMSVSISAIMLGRLGMTVPESIAAFKKLAKFVFKDGKKQGVSMFRYKSSYLVNAVKEVLGELGLPADEPLYNPSENGGCRT